MKYSNSQDSDQYDPKIYRETLGSFGTTTAPGSDQLKELQTKVKQGIKHVELHLGNIGKGNFGVQDVPDKYGFEQRRTIMQLAKLNEQTLSVHGTFNVNSFSGLSQGGMFDDTTRLNAIREIDETVSFAAETAKSGAIVFHLHGDQGVGLENDKGQLNLSKSYLKWLKKKAEFDPKYKEELDNLKKNYLIENPLEREFLSDPNKKIDIKEEFNNLKNEDPNLYQKYINNSVNESSAWKNYYKDKLKDSRKLSQDSNPYIVLGNKLAQVDRNQTIIDINILKEKSNFTLKEQEFMTELGINDNLNIQTIQKVLSFFTNDFPSKFENKISKEEFDALKNKILIDYDDLLKNNDYIPSHADEEFQKKFLDFNINITKLRKEELEKNFSFYQDEYEKIQVMKKKEDAIEQRKKKALEENDTKEIEKLKIEKRNLLNEKQKLIYNDVGQYEYQTLETYNENISKLNEQILQLESNKKNVKSVVDVGFEKNVSAMAHLGINALQKQLELKIKSKQAEEKLNDFNFKIEKLEKEYENASDIEKDKLYSQISKLKYDRRLWVGVKDYSDIDLVEKPLYLAPENMLPGYGPMTSLEDYKAVMRMSQEKFTDKILSDEKTYKKIREDYEQETGLKISNREEALKLAKRHLSGTFDNAHAAVWLKHFKKEEGESEENRLQRFNKWLNTQSEEMVKEGLVKHIHFNDTMGKDDDHNLLGSGVLDLHDMRERFRKAGIKEALIIEAGGRGANKSLQITNALDIFNPILIPQHYQVQSSVLPSTTVSDWTSVQRNYLNRPQFSHYGMHYNTFRSAPNQGQPRGDWSGTGFL